jgi:hypothetical protein
MGLPRVSKRGSRGLWASETVGRKCFLETGRLEEISWGAFFDFDFGLDVGCGGSGFDDFSREELGLDRFVEVGVSLVRDFWARANVPKSIFASSIMLTLILQGGALLNYIVFVVFAFVFVIFSVIFHFLLA